jgi:hypothetical protein
VPEVIGRHDALFDPTSTEQMTALILRALTDDTFHESLKTHATAQAARFSWDVTALRTIDGMEKAFARRAPGGGGSMGQSARRKRLLEALAALAKDCRPSDPEILDLARSIEANNSAAQALRASAAFAGA